MIVNDVPCLKNHIKIYKTTVYQNIVHVSTKIWKVVITSLFFHDFNYFLLILSYEYAVYVLPKTNKSNIVIDSMALYRSCTPFGELQMCYRSGETIFCDVEINLQMRSQRNQQTDQSAE